MPLKEGARNDILPFAPEGLESEDFSGDLVTQAVYKDSVLRIRGHQAGMARRGIQNKVNRQAMHMATGVAQFIAHRHAPGVVDDGDVDKVEEGLVAAIESITASKVDKVDWQSYLPLADADVITTSGTYTVKSSRWHRVTCVGGGAGGGGGRSAAVAPLIGGGGGGGGFVEEVYIFLEQGAVIPVTIGAGGPGGAGGYTVAAGSGVNGGSTTFGTYLTAKGGTGGVGSSGIGIWGQGGAGGTYGTSGQYSVGGDCSASVGGTGGDGYMHKGNLYGRGGNGGMGANSSSGALPGGAGAPGIIIIR